MTEDHNQFRDDLPDDGAGWINRFLAEEDQMDGRMMWRLASWGVGSVAALVVAILATRSPAAINRDQVASAELTRQSQQVQWIAKESQNKARELAAAVDVLNSDRDRLYARVTVLEQGLDSVTGALSKQPAPVARTQTAPMTEISPPSAETATDFIGPIRPAEAPAEAKVEPPAPLPKIAPVATVTPAVAPVAKAAEQKPETPPADQTTAPAVTASLPSAETSAAPEGPSAEAVQRTAFGVDLGTAKSIEGLRGLWRGVTKGHVEQFASLQPIIVVKERHDGFGMQLRLVAGPLADAAEAAKVCASLLTQSNRPCETTVYEGQRLSMTSEKAPEKATQKSAEEHPVRTKRRGKPRTTSVGASPPPVPQDKPKTSSFSSFFGGR